MGGDGADFKLAWPGECRRIPPKCFEGNLLPYKNDQAVKQAIVVAVAIVVVVVVGGGSGSPW